MDFKNKLKNFWRRSAQSAKGFTLVELIVVVAILAILAGIAVPAYSGYVEKANKAADEQLLANVNTAFAAACASNGEDHYGQNPNTTKISLTDADNDGDREEIVLENENAAIVSSFGDFFEGGEFKVITDLQYKKDLGAFVNGDGEIEQLKTYLAASSYNGNLGVVTTQVDNLTGALSTYLAQNFAGLGGSGFATYLEELGVGADEYDKQAEAAILYLAQNAAGMTETDIDDATATMNELLEVILIGKDDQAQYIAKLTEQTGSSLASYAAIYAVAEGIALQQGEGSAAYEALHGDDVNLTDAQSVLTAMSNVLGSLSDEDAANYLINNTSSDMTAYFNALKAVNGKQDVLESEVANGNSIVESDVVKDLIAQVGGN